MLGAVDKHGAPNVALTGMSKAWICRTRQTTRDRMAPRNKARAHCDPSAIPVTRGETAVDTARVIRSARSGSESQPLGQRTLRELLHRLRWRNDQGTWAAVAPSPTNAPHLAHPGRGARTRRTPPTTRNIARWTGISTTAPRALRRRRVDRISERACAPSPPDEPWPRPACAPAHDARSPSPNGAWPAWQHDDDWTTWRPASWQERPSWQPAS